MNVTHFTIGFAALVIGGLITAILNAAIIGSSVAIATAALVVLEILSIGTAKALIIWAAVLSGIPSFFIGVLNTWATFSP